MLVFSAAASFATLLHPVFNTLGGTFPSDSCEQTKDDHGSVAVPKSLLFAVVVECHVHVQIAICTLLAIFVSFGHSLGALFDAVTRDFGQMV